MSELGSLSNYALTIQQTQLSLIKNSNEMQQKVVEVLLENTREASTSTLVGQNVDFTT